MNWSRLRNFCTKAILEILGKIGVREVLEFATKQGYDIQGINFNAGDIDWESHTRGEHSLNRQINEFFFCN